MYLLIAFLPLLLFLFFEIYKGLKAGIYAAIIASVGVLAINWFVYQQWDNLVFGEVVLICIMGLISLYMNDSRFFKLQPVVVGIILAAVILWFQLFDEPLVFKSIAMVAKVDPDLASRLNTPTNLYKMRELSQLLIVTLIIHSLLVLWTALKKSTKTWFFTRLAIYPAVVALSLTYGLLS